MKLALSYGLAVWLLACAFVFACSSTPIQSTCNDIPDGGCPAGAVYGPGVALDASNCIDPTCAALYTYDLSCHWTRVETCPDYKPPHDAGAVDADGSALDTSGPDAPMHDAGVALPDANAAGCEVELESPDCTPDEAVLGPSCNGCEALYVCDDGGWDLWGECYAEAGTIVKVAP